MLWRGSKHDIDPVIGRAPGGSGEGTGGAVGIDAIAAGDAIAQGMQGSTINACGSEVADVTAEVSVVRVIGGDVDGVGGDWNRRREVHLLPAGGGLVGEGGGGEQRAGARPEVADVSAGVGRRLVETDGDDVAGGIGAELDAEF